ncbi:hypothetical protein ACOCGJ_003379 [Vibrio cholerae]
MMQERIKQSEQKIKQLYEDLQKQLLFVSLTEKPTKAMKDKLNRFGTLLEAELCELSCIYSILSMIYDEMITSGNLDIRLKAQNMRSYFPTVELNQSLDLSVRKLIRKNKGNTILD